MTQRTATVVLDGLGAARAVRQPAYTLKVTRGPDRRKRLRFAAARLLIGSAPGAQFQLTDPAVSAVHCELLADETGFRLRDLGAKNGVWLADRRVSDAWLEDGDEFTLGTTRLRFELLGELEQRDLPVLTGFQRLRGSSLRMRELYRQLQQVATSDFPVLLQGESGTGKDLAAEAIMAEGVRRDRPFVVLDCAGLPAGLVESELFGHEMGAFTGAIRASMGVFEQAHGGTLFLDEIGELPVSVQAKLLGALERKTVQRLGGSRPIPVDVRVIAATHRELERDVNRETFRADLFYRLAALQVRMPSLREHPEDIPELVAHFLEELPDAPRLSPDVLQALYDGNYAGNVRELRNEVHRATLGVHSVRPERPAIPVQLDIPYRLQKQRLLDGFELEYLIRLLQACSGNVSEAARRSGLSRVRLHQLLRLWRRKGYHEFGTEE